MPLINKYIELPIVSSVNERVSQVVSAFESITGLTADENNVIWINANKTLGIQVITSSSSFKVSYINANGTAYTPNTGTFNYTAKCYLVYNYSNDKSVFSFGFGTAINIFLPYTIAQDNNDDVYLINQYSSANFHFVGENNYLYFASFPTQQNNQIDTITMVKMPAILSSTTFKNLYYIVFAPAAQWQPDTSIYSDGKLYKVATSQATAGALAYEVSE